MAGIKMSFEMEGMEKLLGNISTVKTKVSSAAYNEIYEEAKDIMEESLTEVPRETGALADSAFLEKEGNDIVFGYGGTNVQINPKSGALTEEYMVAVHEDLNASHPVGKAKFLEDPINRHKKYIESRISRKVRDILDFLR